MQGPGANLQLIKKLFNSGALRTIGDLHNSPSDIQRLPMLDESFFGFRQFQHRLQLLAVTDIDKCPCRPFDSA